ncbi:MAG: hypothetical protein ACXABI_06540, partial [Candidatus Hodarchaeales archaeon]
KFMYVCCWTFGGLVLLIGLLFFIVGLGITSEYWSGISQTMSRFGVLAIIIGSISLGIGYLFWKGLLLRPKKLK